MLLSACGSGLLGSILDDTTQEQEEEETPATGDLCSENMQGVDPVLGELVDLDTLGYSPITKFRQTVSASQEDDTDWDNPFQINYWDLNDDFSMDDGYDDQFDDALELEIGTSDGSGGVTTTSYFPSLTYSDLSFYTPALGSCNGVIASKVLENAVYNDISATGNYHLYVSPTANGRTTQALTVPVNASTLVWNGYESDDTDSFDFAPDRDFRVVLRSPEDQSVLADTAIGNDSLDVTGLAGMDVILSIESNSSAEDARAFIDDMVFQDSGASNIADSVVNGDFETGDLTGWTAVEPSEIQNLMSSAQTLEGVEVRRSFFTIPNKAWARYVDTIHNPSGSEVSIRVKYYTNLGSDDNGLIFPLPAADGMKAMSEYDTDGDRDLGMVFGNDAVIEYESATADGADSYTSGSDQVDHYYDVTIPAGGTVSVVNFLIMNGQTTVYYNASHDYTTDRPVEIEAVANDILENFWTDGQYRTGMTQEQIDSIVNF